ncbi:hypothetical protein ONE63_007457 [Megalurothrips usitatus]|uniref:Uncharacterized protein n=1 Tax=Megalurothrips usitatus TaxID=439358 RepID=A0AAV7XVG5_9NEOP|nr:hypothetical protein ONE63_007457 [Megalurothrips usitatus]
MDAAADDTPPPETAGDALPLPPASPSTSPVPDAAAAAMASLHCAIFRQDQLAVDRLLAAGADPDEPDYSGSGDTALMQAVTAGHLGIVRSLCAAGCSVDARRVNGQSALMLCVVSRASRRSPRLLLQLLEALLAAGADPGVREKLRGQTALHALAKLVAADPREPHLLTALRLLSQRAQPHGVNAQDHRRRTALHHLASRGCASPEPYQILLESRADAALQNARGDTALVEFLENGGDREAAEAVDEVVRLLSGPDVSRRHTQYGESPLHVAARRNRAGAVRAALAAGADPGHQDLRGNTALHLAASRGYREVVALLLAAPGCQVNAANRDGYTALHVAVESGFVDVVNTLLSAEGVEVGPSVLELAQQEYRLRAQPQLARTLASELDRRSSRTSLSLGSLSSLRPPSTCSYSTTASSGTLGATTPQRSLSRGTLADDEEEHHPVNYLGAQVSCTARIGPRYSGGEPQGAGCRPPPYAPRQQQTKARGERRLRDAAQVADEEVVPGRARADAVDESLREAAELMQKLCDEDLSVSPPADWSPPISRSSRCWATGPRQGHQDRPRQQPWQQPDDTLESLRDLRARPAAASVASGVAVERPPSGDAEPRRSSSSAGSRGLGPAEARLGPEAVVRARPQVPPAGQPVRHDPRLLRGRRRRGHVRLPGRVAPRRGQEHHRARRRGRGRPGGVRPHRQPPRGLRAVREVRAVRGTCAGGGRRPGSGPGVTGQGRPVQVQGLGHRHRVAVTRPTRPLALLGDHCSLYT